MFKGSSGQYITLRLEKNKPEIAYLYGLEKERLCRSFFYAIFYPFLKTSYFYNKT